MDFRGFWVCYSAENSASNGTKFILVPFFPDIVCFFFNNQTKLAYSYISPPQVFVGGY